MDNKTLDQILYEAYTGKIKEIFKMDPDVIIPWNDLPQDLKNGWKTCAEAAEKWADEREQLYRELYDEDSFI